MLKEDLVLLIDFTINFNQMQPGGKEQSSQQQVLDTLTKHFPHLQSLMINPSESLSENLQKLVSHIAEPDKANLIEAINGMKDAVDKQELKIQKSLVNAEEPLCSITNRQRSRGNTSSLSQGSAQKIGGIQHHAYPHSQNQNFYQEKCEGKLEGILQQSEMYEQYSQYERNHDNTPADLIDQILGLDEGSNRGDGHWHHHF